MRLLPILALMAVPSGLPAAPATATRGETLPVAAAWTLRDGRQAVRVASPDDRPLPEGFPDGAILFVELIPADNPVETPVAVLRVAAAGRRFADDFVEEGDLALVPGDYRVRVRVDERQPPAVRPSAQPFRRAVGETRVSVGDLRRLVADVNRTARATLEGARAVRREYPGLLQLWRQAWEGKPEAREWERRRRTPAIKALLGRTAGAAAPPLLPRATAAARAFRDEAATLGTDIDYLMGKRSDQERNAAMKIKRDALPEQADGPLPAFDALAETLYREGRGVYAAAAERVFLAADGMRTASPAEGEQTLDGLVRAFDEFAGLDWPLDGPLRAKLSLEFKECVRDVRRYAGEAARASADGAGDAQSRLADLRASLTAQFTQLKAVKP